MGDIPLATKAVYRPQKVQYVFKPLPNQTFAW